MLRRTIVYSDYLKRKEKPEEAKDLIWTFLEYEEALLSPREDPPADEKKEDGTEWMQNDEVSWGKKANEVKVMANTFSS